MYILSTMIYTYTQTYNILFTRIYGVRGSFKSVNNKISKRIEPLSFKVLKGIIIKGPWVLHLPVFQKDYKLGSNMRH